MCALDGLPIDDWKQIKERRLKFGPSVVNEIKRIGLSEDAIMNNTLYKSIKKRPKQSIQSTYLDRLYEL